MFTAPVLDEHGEIMAILSGALNLLGNNGITHLRDVKIGQHGFLAMLSSDRRILLHSDLSRIYTYIEPGTHSIVDKVLREHFEGILNENERYLVTAKWLKYKDWVILLYHPEEEIEQPLFESQTIILWRALSMFFLGVVVILYLTNRLLQPMEAFVAHIRELMNKTGKDRYFYYSGKDEIQDMSVAFNSLIKELDARYEELHKNNEIFQTLTLFSTDVICWFDINNELIYISPNCLSLTGYTDVEFYQQAQLLESIILPEDIHIWNTHIHGQNDGIEFRIRHRKGNILWIRHVCNTILNATGEVIGYRGNLIDITSQKLAEFALMEQKELLHHLIDTLPVAVCLKDGESRWLVANKRFKSSAFPMTSIIFKKTKRSLRHCLPTKRHCYMSSR